MIVNELKTKLMIFGNREQTVVKFNGNIIELVDKYKYLGNVVTSIGRPIQDAFQEITNIFATRPEKPSSASVRKLKIYTLCLL